MGFEPAISGATLLLYHLGAIQLIQVSTSLCSSVVRRMENKLYMLYATWLTISCEHNPLLSLIVQRAKETTAEVEANPSVDPEGMRGEETLFSFSRPARKFVGFRARFFSSSLLPIFPFRAVNSQESTRIMDM